MPELTFKQKVMMKLYGLGLKNFGPELLQELPAGSPEWQQMAGGLLEGNDFPSRKIVLKQLTARRLLERHAQKRKLMDMLLAYLSRGISEEKRAVAAFIEKNLELFPTDADAFKAKILALQRERDMQLNQVASRLLPRLGIDMDDRSLYRSKG